MAAVRSLRVSVNKSSSGSERSDSDSDSGSDRDDPREAEPMEVEEGEIEADDVSVNRSLKELLPDTSRRYENKAGTFITGIDVNSKEAIEKKEKRAQRFAFCAEVNQGQRNVVLDRDTMSKAIPKARMEAIHMTGVDDMSTGDIFGYFKEYPPAHIEWIDDTSCNVVWLDDVSSIRALLNMSRMPEAETEDTEQPDKSDPQIRGRGNQGSDKDADGDGEEGQVGEDVAETLKKNSEQEGEADKKTEAEDSQVDNLSQAERESLLRNDLRPVTKPFKGNDLCLRVATHDDKKEPGAARRSRYYMKYGNPNYGGMKGILSNSWKRRYHTRRIQRDVIKSKKPVIGDSMGHTPPYTHRHSADLVNLPEEPIKEEEEEDEEARGGQQQEEEEDMDSDDRVVEYKERAERAGTAGLRSAGGLRSRAARSSSQSSDSDEMDYDLELKMISTPSPKKSMKMTMYADELETQLKTIRNSVREDSGSGSGVRSRIGESLSAATSPSAAKVTDVRQLLEEKRLTQQRPQDPMAAGGKTDVRQRLGKRRYSPERRSPSPASPPAAREPNRDVHSRLGTAGQDARGLFANSSKDRKTGRLWSRLGPSNTDRPHEKNDDQEEGREEEEEEGGHSGRRVSSREPATLSSRLGDLGDDGGNRRRRRRSSGGRGSGGGGTTTTTTTTTTRRKTELRKSKGEEEEEDDSTLQKVWGAMIKQKEEQQSHRTKKSRLDNLPSLQIEISRESSEDSDS